jgi:2-polyprenyl-3-methyl-5-hydroxy-6-metoxy-1,4-benzoquinol methylase
MDQGSFYDDRYRTTPGYFGSEPSTVLREHGDRIKPKGRVLDLGCGEGRNALWLAERGCRVEAVDSSGVGLKRVLTGAEELGVRVRCFLADVRSFTPPRKTYDAILALGLVTDLLQSEARELFDRIARWTRKEGLVFVSAFTVDHPKYGETKRTWKEVEPNSFRNEEGRVRTFLRKNGVLELLPGFEKVHHFEGMGPLHRHGDGPEERHAVVHLVARKKA